MDRKGGGFACQNRIRFRLVVVLASSKEAIYVERESPFSGKGPSARAMSKPTEHCRRAVVVLLGPPYPALCGALSQHNTLLLVDSAPKKGCHPRLINTSTSVWQVLRDSLRNGTSHEHGVGCAISSHGLRVKPTLARSWLL